LEERCRPHPASDRIRFARSRTGVTADAALPMPESLSRDTERFTLRWPEARLIRFERDPGSADGLRAMTDEEHDHPAGVFYALNDHAGLGRRLLILVIDGLVLYVGYLASKAALGWGALGSASPYVGALGFATFCYLYLAVLARSRFGTLGYAVASVRVVDLTGARPSLACMSFRTAFALLGPLNVLLDLLWVGNDSNRQALRDRLPGTYVVRKGAVPAGVGPQKCVLIWFLGYGFIVREVGRRAPSIPLGDRGARSPLDAGG
jgi:uncharacterized RDD family membrane protein YckC